MVVCGKELVIAAYQLDGTVRPMHKFGGTLLLWHMGPKDRVSHKATWWLDDLFKPCE